MPTIVDLSGLDRLIARLNRLADPNPAGLMIAWMRIIEADNRRGVLAGLDKDGNPLKPVTYRPKGTAAAPTKAQRGGRRANAKRGLFAGFGPHAAGLHGNLTSAEYRKLDGPPLAPRRQFSRVITNLKLDQEIGPGPMQWSAVGIWDEVVSTKGVKFLPYHFDGGGNLPVRDLRGVRPEGRAEARKALIAWAADQIRMQA